MLTKYGEFLCHQIASSFHHVDSKSIRKFDRGEPSCLRYFLFNWANMVAALNGASARLNVT